MRWILVDVAIALVALAVLGVLGFGLYRRVRVLLKAVSAAGEQVARATDALAAAQMSGPLGTAGEGSPTAAGLVADGAAASTAGSTRGGAAGSADTGSTGASTVAEGTPRRRSTDVPAPVRADRTGRTPAA